ncbi:MAG: hypothetical protein P8180_08280 [Gammaproteobacteria bacterium]
MISFHEIRLALIYMTLTLAVVIGVLAIPFHYWAQSPQQIAQADTPKPAVALGKVQVQVNGRKRQMTVQELLFDYMAGEGDSRTPAGASAAAIRAPRGC